MSDEVRRCETCNVPVGPTDMQYERDGGVWCETHAPPWAFAEDELAIKYHCNYCGGLDWTVEKWGRVTHKEGCPHRTDPWTQAQPHADERP